jgi:hypothetical protein
MHRIFENSNTDWVHFSEYEYRLDNDGELYIVPIQGAELKNYVPANIPDLILIDSLNIGKMLAERKDMVMIKATILDFYRHYGVLGFMTAFPLSLDFLEKKSVLLGSNPLTNRDTMETQKYIQLFTPFGEIADSRIRKLNQMFLDRPKIYDIVFSRGYAEKLDWATQYFKDLYLHFGACYYIDRVEGDGLFTEYSRRIAKMTFPGIGYHFYYKPGQALSLDYDFPSLKSVIDTAYSFAVTADPVPLKLCKDCEKVFFVSNQRTEFCSVQCRNKHNTRKFRSKD